MDNLENRDYCKKRSNLRLLEDENDIFVEAHYKRKLLLTNYQSSISEASNATTCRVLQDDFSSYASLVDSRGANQINNYSAAATNLASHCTSESKEWKSHLSKRSNDMKTLIDKLKCQECSIWEPPPQLSKLFSEQPRGPGESGSPRVRKNSDRGPPVASDLSKWVVPVQPKELHHPVANVSVPGNIHRPDLAVKTYGKSVLAPSAPEQVSRSVNKSYAESSTYFSKPRPFLSNAVTDAGGSWNVGKPGNNSRDIQPNLQRESFGNSYDGDSYGNAHLGSNSEWNGNGFRGRGDQFRGCGDQIRGRVDQFKGRGDRFRGRGGRGFNAMGSRTPADDQYRNHQESSDAGMSSSAANFFKTARDELVEQNAKKNNGSSRGTGYGSSTGRGYGTGYNTHDVNNYSGDSESTRAGGLQYGAQKRSLGTRRGGGVFSKFVPPVRPDDEEQNNRQDRKHDGQSKEDEIDERLKNIDPKMIELIRNEIMDISAPVCWDDIAGLEFAKSTIQEIVVWPMMRPDIFTGLRKPPKGLLLFGPPGTGKTLIGKCIASQSQSTFFSISASSLTSKWIGDGEKMVRALFAVAKCHQPAVVFIDEIDSLLTQRSDTEHESSRRIKTEFLVQLDGAGTGEEERILVVGATNRPQELDEAARRRLVKRLYIPLPEFEARRQIVERLMSSERNQLTPEEINEIARLTDGYSGADMKNVCQEASLGPIRSLSLSDMHQITAEQVRPVNFDDFRRALQRVRASVSQKDLDQYLTWDQTYGMSGAI